MMTRRLLIFMVVMASLVATGRPATIAPEMAAARQTASRPWPERLNVGRALSRIAVLQRITLATPRPHIAVAFDFSTSAIRPALVNPLRCALPPPAIDYV